MARASAGAADNLEEVVRCAVREELASQSGRSGTARDRNCKPKPQLTTCVEKIY